ncbi:hypothetical protein SAMN02745157_4808 [Kaistia soli DSM 19436]|uniref:Uncharacterized protein n=1 Tax=Kaistia soli DSM 19436 TaxID=1122133 RepID=A0A1M5MJS6_9HYPH|nr:hypothetical protein SAMN02745157_4808 [Kaistia soli DSM 19436]
MARLRVESVFGIPISRPQSITIAELVHKLHYVTTTINSRNGRIASTPDCPEDANRRSITVD